MSPAPDARYPSARTGWYATALLTLAYTFSFVDRQVLNLLVEPIRADLGVSDTQISLLQGLAFVGTYVLLSVPIGRLVDRANRVAVLVAGVLVWSAATVGCGLARSYAGLLVARLGVGAGESSVTPAAWSVLADYFHPDRLARPVSVFLMGPYLGAGLALIAGAEVIEWARAVDSLALPLVGELAPWQFTFVAVGLPGLLVAGLLTTLRDPPRVGPGAGQAAPAWREVAAYLCQHGRVYAALLLGVPFIVVMLYGLQAWVPTLLVRVYDWDLPRAGRVYGLIALLAGSAGVLSGPYASAWLRARGHADHPLRLAVYATALLTLAAGLLPWQADARGALICVAAASYFVTLPLALMTSALQIVSPPSMRGVVAGLYVVTVNVLGLGLGPTLVALFTDRWFGDPAAVGKSLALVAALVAPPALGLLASGMRPYAERAGALTAVGEADVHG